MADDFETRLAAFDRQLRRVRWVARGLLLVLLLGALGWFTARQFAAVQEQGQSGAAQGQSAGVQHPKDTLTDEDHAGN